MLLAIAKFEEVGVLGGPNRECCRQPVIPPPSEESITSSLAEIRYDMVNTCQLLSQNIDPLDLFLYNVISKLDFTLLSELCCSVSINPGYLVKACPVARCAIGLIYLGKP